MNNEVSENMKNIEPFVRSLKKRYPDLPVEYVDERFTSVLAPYHAGGRFEEKDRQNKALVDEINCYYYFANIFGGKRFSIGHKNNNF